ncbi:redoxin domain-containing protein [Papillibacter cinnamivorans]|uniref:Peroxiredoxin n=1 Tax=Papillibacter cinnamivorans DSM 12816 TaxID=1122930 RepID=A0A1W2AIE5_9FIRM|nr:redoxin domain-containing protein [Papillibacter cinnamivorans]SMC60475.1 Peroxiredoxin [Papillibacter cinnamivorans DSM 12816]
MELMKAGMKAPEFSLKDQKSQSIKLSDYRGKTVLLSWHPLAWTSVCLDQMRSLETNWERFQELGTVPFGASVDTVPSKKIWAEAIAIQKVSLLCDFWPHGKVAEEYGIFNEKLGFSERANIIVDGEGTVRWVKVYPISQLPDIQEVLQAIRGL